MKPAHLDSVGHATAVGVDQAANQRLWVSIGYRLLPLCQFDRSLVFATGPMLREHADPVLRVGMDLRTAGHLRRPNLAGGHDPRHRVPTLAHQRRIRVATEDAQSPDVAWPPAETAITEMEAEQVRIRRGDGVGSCGTGLGSARVADTGGAATGGDDFVSQRGPFAQRGTGNRQLSRDRRLRLAVGRKASCEFNNRGGFRHAASISNVRSLGVLPVRFELTLNGF